METLVQEIHNAVTTAAETLLQQEAYDPKQIKALKDLGFVNSENVTDYEDHQRHNSLACDYAQRYPHYKFITEHQLEKITKKYKLSTGEVNRFLGNIPEKNITEMVNCKIFTKDLRIPETMWSSRFERGGRLTPPLDSDEFSSLYRSIWGITKEVRERERSRNNHNRSPFDDFNERAERKRHDFQGFTTVKLTDIVNNSKFESCVSITADPELFQRPAPELDPIVTVAVKGGFLVITAWGDEANDPDIINPTMN